MDLTKIGAIDRLAREAVIHNQAPGYNCQDYVLELLDALERRALLMARERDIGRVRRL